MAKQVRNNLFTRRAGTDSAENSADFDGAIPGGNLGNYAHEFYPKSGLFFSKNPGVLVVLS
jgi:hypothetical protein